MAAYGVARGRAAGWGNGRVLAAVLWHARAERHATGCCRQFVQCIGGVWAAQGEARLLAGMAAGVRRRGGAVLQQDACMGIGEEVRECCGRVAAGCWRQCGLCVGGMGGTIGGTGVALPAAKTV
jgi:hypothetical protein